MNTRHEHDTHSHTTSPLRAPSCKVLILTPEEAPPSSEFFLLFAFACLFVFLLFSLKTQTTLTLTLLLPADVVSNTRARAEGFYKVFTLSMAEAAAGRGEVEGPGGSVRRRGCD